jgi:hypothetical protein
MDRGQPNDKRPMAKAQRVGLFARQIIETVSATGIELLLGSATCLSEGQLAADGRYYGSSMITIDLGALSARVSDPCDAATAARLARRIREDPAMRARCAAHAGTAAGQIARGPLRSVQTEVQVRAEGCMVYVDVDVEALAGRAAAEET